MIDPRWFDDEMAFWAASNALRERIARFKRKLNRALLLGHEQQADIIEQKIKSTRAAWMKISILWDAFYDH
ncbi:hypothetical protein P4S70_25640 [Enterovibrio sp. Hal110]